MKVDPRTPAGLNTLLAHVAAGKPALAATSDHIAFVRPNQPAGLTPAKLGSLSIAQAGPANFTLGTLSQGWRASRLKEIAFFVHE